jgi:hypothetical protein
LKKYTQDIVVEEGQYDILIGQLLSNLAEQIKIIKQPEQLLKPSIA